MTKQQLIARCVKLEYENEHLRQSVKDATRMRFLAEQYQNEYMMKNAALSRKMDAIQAILWIPSEVRGSGQVNEVCAPCSVDMTAIKP